MSIDQPVFHRDLMQASNGARTLPSSHAALMDRRMRSLAVYPEVPAGWPNRATRRAIKQRQEHLLSSSWSAVLALHPQLRQHIKEL